MVFSFSACTNPAYQMSFWLLRLEYPFWTSGAEDLLLVTAILIVQLEDERDPCFSHVWRVPRFFLSPNSVCSIPLPNVFPPSYFSNTVALITDGREIWQTGTLQAPPWRPLLIGTKFAITSGKNKSFWIAIICWGTSRLSSDLRHVALSC